MVERASPNAEEELRIALLLIEGKEEALFALLEAYAPKIKGILLKNLGTILADADVDDVLLIAAQKVFDAAGDFDERKGTLGGWFYRIAFRTAIDRLRKLGGKPTAALDEDYPAPAETNVETEGQLDDGTRNDLIECVERLGALQRKIINADLLAGGQVDGESLSRKLGIPKQHVYSYREKAHKALEKCMSKRGHTGETIRSNP